MKYLPHTQRMYIHPRFGVRQCPQCVSNHTPSCSICGGAGWVTVPVGLYAQIINRQIKRGAMP